VGEDASPGVAFGPLLQDLRRTRGKTQLSLALDAGVSQRHLSFLEKGRSRASRSMILALSTALALPLRERNALLLAGGFAPVYGECSLASPEMVQVRRVLDSILEKQEPFPAVVLDRYWNLLMSNTSAQRLFGSMVDLTSVPGPPNLLRLIFDPAGVRPFVRNWEDVACTLISRMRSEAVGGYLDERLTGLLEELRSFPGFPSQPVPDDRNLSTLPFIAVELNVGNLDLSFLSAVTTLGAPNEVTAQELRVECFFPADSRTEAAMQRLAAV
jgi:transcriptional regulator with XRE-family HTH domain